MCWQDAAPKAATNSPSATREWSVTPRPANSPNSFPKKSRLLGSADFRRVYDKGIRFSTPLFAAFLLVREDGDGPRVGFTVPRALGKAVKRNRIRRRVREALRLRLNRVDPKWDIVINPRRAVLDASWEAIGEQVDRLIRRCGNL